MPRKMRFSFFNKGLDAFLAICSDKAIPEQISFHFISIHRLIPGITTLKNTLDAKSAAYMHIVKIGRTHFMDATPLTLGQEISGYASQLKHGLKAIHNTLEHLSELALGGTAVGTGINTPKGYSENVAKHIAKLTATVFSAPCASTMASCAANASNLFSAVTKGNPVSLAICLATFSE